MTKSNSSKKGTSGLTERATYAYDYRGLLVKKTYAEFTADEGVSITGGSTASVTEWYEYNQNGQLLYTEKSDDTATAKTDYIWAETTLWCEVDDGEVYYHHTDHLGTTEAVTDSDGNIVWHAEYEAFGSVLSENGSRTFTPNFTGKMLDECSGLYYFNARWYDSECGRFTTQDPARDGINWWNYCKGNPLKYVDPDGRDIKGAFRGLANMVSAGFEVTGGIFLMGCAAAGEIGSVALATPVAVAVGVVGFAAFVDGVANFGFAAADFTVELVDCFTDDISVDGDLLPANIGGAIGSGIDQNNGFDIQTENKKGPVQVKGENINGVVSLGLTTSAYLGSVVESVSTQAPASTSQVINEVSHQYDIYNNTKLIVEKEE